MLVVSMCEEADPSSGRLPPMYPTLRDGFTSHTGVRVDVSRTVSHGVSVCYPRHLSSASPHVRCRHVQSVCMQ